MVGYVVCRVVTGCLGFPNDKVPKNPPANAGDVGSIPGWGKIPWRKKWQPLQNSCLENSVDRGAWWAYSPWGCRELDTTERLSRHARQQGAWEADLVKSECIRAGDLSPAPGAALFDQSLSSCSSSPAATLDGGSWGALRP